MGARFADFIGRYCREMSTTTLGDKNNISRRKKHTQVKHTLCVRSVR